MRVLCPSCQQLVNLPDSAAGQLTPCPLCSRTFTPPALTGAAVDAAPPPTFPPVETRSSKPDLRIAQESAPQSPSPSYGSLERCCTCTLQKEVVVWIAPVALFLAFVLTFFTWVAAAPNGTRVYTQSGWQAAFGGFTVDPYGEEIFNRRDALNSTTRASSWLVLYSLLLILTMLLAVGNMAVSVLKLTVPDALHKIWPHRDTIVAGLCAILLISLLFPMFTGFGLQTAVVQAAESQIPPPQSKAEGATPTPKDQIHRDLNRDIEVAKFGVVRTSWFCWSIWIILAALIGALLDLWLDRRGDRPEPRAEWYC
jgi:hypothetical protein